MAEIIEDRVKQTSTSTGLSDFALSSNIAGYRAFSSVMSVGDTFHGAIVAVDSTGAPTGEWETGYYTYSAADTIARTTVRSSSATSNAKVSFSAGTKHVFLDLTAYQIKQFSTSSSTGAAVSPYGQTASQYSAPTFQEEFNGTTVNSATFKTDIYYKTNNATQNFSVGNGNLNIWPQRDGSNAFFDRTFVTDGLFSQTYGFFEAEMKLPVGAGLHPVFSLFNNDEHEIAIMHAYCGAPTGGWATTSMHPVDWVMTRLLSQAAGGDEQRAHNYITVPDLSAAFHKYGMRWDATTVKWYFDGVQVGPTVNHTNMTVPMYFYVGLWMSSTETSPTAGSGTLSPSNQYTPEGSSNSLQVNYIRAWNIV